tara:strand:+ start:54 stop:392 length:339 start_codon:yes stop_codon:yes gene_type:complete
MYQKNICLNTKTWVSFSTGNKGCLDHIKDLKSPTPDDVRRALYKCSILERVPVKDDDNYNVWTRSVQKDGLDFFFVVSVKAETKIEVNEQVKKIIADNGWKVADICTSPTKT